MILGLTGGIGCGKSAVLNILNEEHGFYIFEADKVAHELMMPEHVIYKNVVAEFGADILQENGEIHRQKLGALVFNSKEKLARLDELTHPAVIAEIQNRILDIQKMDVNANFVIEAALLIESGCYKICDKVWYIYANEGIRKNRLMKYRGYTEVKIENVMKNQLSHNEFLEYADDTIDNSGTIGDTRNQIQKLLVL